jgi:GntR family transcriptional regulator/MocR family aminotransferase
MRAYGERREVFADALRTTMGERVSFDLPDGGLALWVRFAAGIDPDRLATAARARRVAFTPGSSFAMQPMAVGAARLGFASLTPTELVQAVRRLATAMGDLR